MASVSIPERCLICYQKLSSRELNRRKLANCEQIEEAFSTDMVFTLKTLLKVPEEVFERFVGSCGNQVPGLWISLCDSCIEGVVEAKMIYQEILELSRKFKCVQDKVVDKLKRSWLEDEDKVKGNYPRKKAKMKEGNGLSVTDECRKCVNERLITDEESFLVEDVAAFTRRICGRLSAPDNFGFEAQNVIILPTNQPFVHLERLILDDNQDKDYVFLEHDDNPDPPNISDEAVKDPLSLPDDEPFDKVDQSADVTAENISDVDYKEDIEMKPEVSLSPENSDSDWQQDESSEVEDSEDDGESEVKTISAQLVLDNNDGAECPTCQKEFRNVQGLKTHLWQIHKVKIVKPEKVRTCPEQDCTFTCKDYREYHHHLRCHKRGEPKHKCQNCERAFFDIKGLRHHTKLVHNITLPPKRVRAPTLQCPKCPKMCPTVISMRHHMLTIHDTEYVPEPGKIFPCTWPNCGKILSAQETLRVHLSRHEKKPGYKCDRCEETFYTHDLRKEHRDAVHPALPFSCDICQKSFASSGHLFVHQRHSHGDNKRKDKPRKIKKIITKKKNELPKKKIPQLQRPKAKPKSKEVVQCELCGKQYSSRATLQTHLKFKHEQNFQIRCSICNQGMRGNSSLKVHMVATHKVSMDPSGQLPQCPVIGCREVFSEKKLLDQHITKIHGESGTEPRFQCSHCGKGFQKRFRLIQHEMLHLNGETKPFKCDICGKGFANQVYVRSHQLTTHKAERKRSRRKEVMPRSILNRKSDKPAE